MSEKVVELDRMIGTLRRNIEYLEQRREEEVQREAFETLTQCGILPVGGILNLGRFTATAEAESTPTPNPLQKAEDHVSLWLNGGQCTIANHEAATEQEEMIMLLQLRLKYPHQSTVISEIRRAISKANK